MPLALPGGLTKLSEIYQLRTSIVESAPNTYTQETIETGIDAISREVLAIWYVGFGVGVPDPTVPGAGVTSTIVVTGQLVMRTKVALATLDDFDLIAKLSRTLVLGGDQAAGGGISLESVMSPPDGTVQIGNFPMAFVTSRQMFLGVYGGAGNTNVKTANMRAFVQRVKASADVYAALIGARNA